MTLNRSRPPGLIPTLYYEDVGKVIDWLIGAFGFTERFRYGGPDSVAGAQLATGDGFVMLSVARTGQGSGWGDDAELGPPRSGEVCVTLSVHVDDVDAVFEQSRDFGARILHGPETYPFGERQFTAEDPGGYRWTFSQTVEDVAPETWGASLPAPRTLTR